MMYFSSGFFVCAEIVGVRGKECPTKSGESCLLEALAFLDVLSSDGVQRTSNSQLTDLAERSPMPTSSPTNNWTSAPALHLISKDLIRSFTTRVYSISLHPRNDYKPSISKVADASPSLPCEAGINQFVQISSTSIYGVHPKKDLRRHGT